MAHFALQKLHIIPSVLNDMNDREKAFIYASIQLRAEEEKRASDKMRWKGGRR